MNGINPASVETGLFSDNNIGNTFSIIILAVLSLIIGIIVPTVGYGFFVAIVMAFVSFSYGVIYIQMETMELTNIPNSLWFKLFMILWGILTALNASYYSSVLQDDTLEPTRWFSLFYATVMSFVFVILAKFPIFVGIFGNTLGRFLGANDIKEMLQSQAFDNETDLSSFISLFHLDNIASYDPKATDPIFDITLKDDVPLDDFKKEVRQYCMKKHLFGHFIWVFLTSVLLLMATTYQVAKIK